MKRRLQLKNSLAVAILGMAAALALFIVSNLRGNAPEESLPSLPQNVDVSLQKIHYTETRDGTEAWSLVADSAAHNLAEGVARIENIHMTFYDSELGDLQLRADHGKLRTDQEEVSVMGDVQIISPEGYRFLTERLNYRDADRVVSSDSPVRLIADDFQIRGRGLRLNVDDRTLVLKHDVRADFPHGLDGIGK